ncbi:amino acid ABC transporter permease [Conyzicola sp.]|uniref:amino acid ABC transporter permease n=1 Tax=Conyzicola sp. TaxID=1969404 RepID=UPI003988D52C
MVLVAFCVWTLVTAQAFQWPVVGDYLFNPRVIAGVWTTIYLTILAMTFGCLGGLLLAIMRRSPSRALIAISSGIVWFFRGTPTLVQLIFWFNLASLFPRLEIGIPFGQAIWSVDTNTVMTPLLAAILALGINEAAYMSEIIRAGLGSVDNGQVEAAKALGMRSGRTMRRIILPQAMRTIIPPTGNELIGMLKFTSLASVISVTELLSTTQQIYNQNYQVIPLLVVASIWYLALTSVLSVGQARVEQRFGRGVSGTRNGWQHLTTGFRFRKQTSFEPKKEAVG